MNNHPYPKDRVNSTELFGYDKFGKALYEGAIVKYLDEQNTERVGHLFFKEDGGSEYEGWLFSLAHSYGENSASTKGCKNFRLMAYEQADYDAANALLQNANW